MNQYPSWKYLLIATIVIIGALYALPNLYGDDPALQVTPTRAVELNSSAKDTIDIALATAGIEPKGREDTLRGVQFRFNDLETQSKAQQAISEALGNEYVVALNLAPATPEWLRSLGGEPMYLGLDLRGGIHFLMEVDMDTVKQQTETGLVSELRGRFRDDKIRHRGVKVKNEGGILIKFKESETRTAADDIIAGSFPQLLTTETEKDDLFFLNLSLTDDFLRETKKNALQQNITTLRNRVNELGVAEPVIQQQGDDRIVVQLPGVQDPAKAKELLGATATLEFRMVDEEADVEAALRGKVPVTSKLYRSRDGRDVLLKKRIMLTGDSIIGASSGLEQQSGTPAVFITLDGKGARKFSRATREQVGHLQAVVFIEKKTETIKENGENVKVRKTVEEVINIATIQSELGKRFQITGLDSTEEARDLALLLRAGALAAPIEIIEERTIGPSLGKDNISKGFTSVMIGFLLVLIFMAVYYRVFGLVANLALTVNLVMIVALLSIMQATLTMPGIAGIVLTVGMAVDANVLIFERIREELRSGNTPQASIQSGYEKAFSTIADANITTLIAAIVLFGFGTGPIKGFAVTLTLGIITSMFTAIMGTRAVINFIYGGKRNVKLAI